MLNEKTMNKRTDENLYDLYEIFNRRSKDESLRAEVIAIFITNLELVIKEMNKRGLNYNK